MSTHGLDRGLDEGFEEDIPFLEPLSCQVACIVLQQGFLPVGCRNREVKPFREGLPVRLVSRVLHPGPKLLGVVGKGSQVWK